MGICSDTLEYNREHNSIDPCMYINVSNYSHDCYIPLWEHYCREDTMMMHFREKDKDSAYYNKEGNYNMIFTSNKNPALWREDFNEDSTLLCALDRIFDDATVFKLRGESFRGKKLETISLQTGKVKAIEPVTEIEE